MDPSDVRVGSFALIASGQRKRKALVTGSAEAAGESSFVFTFLKQDEQFAGAYTLSSEEVTLPPTSALLVAVDATLGHQLKIFGHDVRTVYCWKGSCQCKEKIVLKRRLGDLITSFMSPLRSMEPPKRKVRRFLTCASVKRSSHTRPASAHRKPFEIFIRPTDASFLECLSNFVTDCS